MGMFDTVIPVGEWKTRLVCKSGHEQKDFQTKDIHRNLEVIELRGPLYIVGTHDDGGSPCPLTLIEELEEEIRIYTSCHVCNERVEYVLQTDRRVVVDCDQIL